MRPLLSPVSCLLSPVSQSFLSGPSLIAVPTNALALREREKGENDTKVGSLFRRLAINSNSLVVKCELTENMFILSPCNLPASFLLTPALTASTLLPLPEASSLTEEDDNKILTLVDRLPHKFHYNPLEYSGNIISTKTKGRARKK